MNRLDNEYIKRLEWKIVTSETMEDKAEYADKRNHVRKQIEVIAAVPKNWKTIQCVCGRNFVIENTFRCLYCGERFCEKCAEIHFGQTREEYDAK